MLASEPAYFSSYHFYPEIPIEVSVPGVPGCNYYISEHSILESLYYGDVARLRATLCLGFATKNPYFSTQCSKFSVRYGLNIYVQYTIIF
jgi:hypothetical protein